MSRVGELWTLFREDEATPQDIAELKERLRNPQERHLLVQECWLDAALIESLRLAGAVDQPGPIVADASSRPTAASASRRLTRPLPAPMASSSSFTPGWLRWWIGMPAAAGLAALLLAFMYLGGLGQPNRENLAAIVAGAPAAVLRQGAALKGYGGMKLKEGDLVTAAAAEPLEIHYADGSALVLEPGSRVLLGLRRGTGSLGLKPGKAVQLLEGSLTAKVSPQQGSEPALFRSAELSATVLGTEFTLRTAAGRGVIELREGRLAIQRASDGAESALEAGQLIEAGAGADFTPRPLESGPASAITPTLKNKVETP